MSASLDSRLARRLGDPWDDCSVETHVADITVDPVLVEAPKCFSIEKLEPEPVKEEEKKERGTLGTPKAGFYSEIKRPQYSEIKRPQYSQ